MIERIQKHLREKKGFTLIELAIVLVIIGIIIGAILKGGDLIEGARHKKLTNDGKQWEAITWAFMDRQGRFPGDTSPADGIIEGDPHADIRDRGRFVDAPTVNSVTLGGYRFYLWLGNTGAAGAQRNVIGITNRATTPVAFTTAELAYMEAFDTSIDGVAGGTAGRVRGLVGPPTVTSGTWLITHGSHGTDAWALAPPGALNVTALLYYFDRLP